MLKAAREEAKVSQRELARQLGVTHPTIGRWESGETPINAEDASAYLACVGVVGEEREKILRIARGDDEEDCSENRKTAHRCSPSGSYESVCPLLQAVRNDENDRTIRKTESGFMLSTMAPATSRGAHGAGNHHANDMPLPP